MNQPETIEAPPARQALHIDDEWELQRHVDRTRKLQELMAHERIYSVEPQLARDVHGQALILEALLQNLLAKART